MSSIERINYLCKLLKESITDEGSFPSVSSENQKSTNVITNALILASLNCIKDNDDANFVKDKLANYLRSIQAANGTFNYSKDKIYPNDFDDTFCSLSALYEYDHDFVTAKSLAKCIFTLRNFELKPGGPYESWIVERKARTEWKDIDIAVNSNIAYFFLLLHTDLANINRYIEQKITSNEITSKYYYSNITTIYFTSRFYKELMKKKLINYLLTKKDLIGIYKNLAIISLSNFGCKIPYEPDQLIHQNAPIPFIVEKITKNTLVTSGSKYLEIAVLIEAMMRFDNQFREISKREAKDIKIALKKDLEDIPPPIRLLAYNKCVKTLALDPETVLFPLIIYETTNKTLSNKLINQMCLASIYGWAAYSIYDNILDEKSQIQLLPLANLLLKKLTLIYNRTENIYHIKLADKMLNILDNGMLKDQEHVGDCKEYYKIIVERSLGHAIGPLYILAILKSDTSAFKQFFKHYVLAKQILDDLLDWREDLKNNTNNLIALEFKENTGKLEEIYFNGTAKKYCKKALSHLKKAKFYLYKIPPIITPTKIEALLHKLEQSAQQNIFELDLLKEYTALAALAQRTHIK